MHFALDSAVVEAQNMLSSHGGFLTVAMYHHGETIYCNLILTHYHETKKRAHDSEVVRAKQVEPWCAQLQTSIGHQPADKSFASEPSLNPRPDPKSCN